MKYLSHLLGRSPKPARRQLRRTQPRLESLEERLVLSSAHVVPLGETIDHKTTFHLLQDAVNAATSGGVIVIASGTTADSSPVAVNVNSLTIAGDSNASADSLA